MNNVIRPLPDRRRECPFERTPSWRLILFAIASLWFVFFLSRIVLTVSPLVARGNDELRADRSSRPVCDRHHDRRRCLSVAIRCRPQTVNESVGSAFVPIAAPFGRFTIAVGHWLTPVALHHARASGERLIHWIFALAASERALAASVTRRHVFPGREAGPVGQCRAGSAVWSQDAPGTIQAGRGSRMLRRLRVSGLLSFGPPSIDLPLESLNVLIGPNGSGKSNVLGSPGVAPRRAARARGTGQARRRRSGMALERS